MDNESLNSLPQTGGEEINETPAEEDTRPTAGKEIFVPVKYNKEIRNLALDEAAVLAQKGLKFDAISEDYENLRRIASKSGKSVPEFILELDNDRTEARKKELSDKCGGNGEMAEYIIGLEKGGEGDMGFKELNKYFPDIKEPSDLPETVVENAVMKGTMLLDEYLRYRLDAKREAARASAERQNAAKAGIGPQTDRGSAVNPETAEFLKGLWR